MVMKPNYRHDRAERDRLARIKKLEKQQMREAKSAQRKAEQDVAAPELSKDILSNE